jgi:hypothetical protein
VCGQTTENDFKEYDNTQYHKTDRCSSLSLTVITVPDSSDDTGTTVLARFLGDVVGPACWWPGDWWTDGFGVCIHTRNVRCICIAYLIPAMYLLFICASVSLNTSV